MKHAFHGPATIGKGWILAIAKWTTARQSLDVGSSRGAMMASAPVKAIDQEGESPFQANVTSLKYKGNCVAARQGGEQPELNDQSVTK